jgi:hypothetical protein
MNLSIKTTNAMLLRQGLFLILLTLSFGANAQLPWNEDFDSYSPGTGIDNTGDIGDYPSSVTQWSLNTSGASFTAASDYIKTVSGALQARDTDGDVIWTSSSINISGCTNVSFSVDITEIGDHESADYVDVEYSINGGAYTLISNWSGLGSATHTLVGDIPDDNDWGSQTVTQGGLSGTSIQIRITINNNAGAELIEIDNISVTGSCGGPPPPTITAGSISGGPFSVDCSGPTTDSGTFSFTSTGTFNAGNVFTAELTNGTALGTFSASGVDPSGGISITIPSDLATGTYDVQITSSDPNAVSGTVSINVTQTGSCEPPHINSVIINSCNSVCQEGQNELVFGNTGDYSVLVNETNFNFSYTNTPPTLQNYTDNLTNNATTTQELNNECPATFPFIDAYGTTIPPSSSWILASDDLCPTDALDWTGLCFSGPIYVIYTTDPTWSLSGNFSNTTSGIRPYQTSITTTSGQTFTIDYETDGSQYPDDDGVYATFDSNGGPATGYGDDDCIIQPVLLPVELASFTGMDVNGKNTFLWKTVSERNSSHFELLNSIDGQNWLTLGSIPAAGYTESIMNYSFDHAPRPVINYYRLKQYDLDGSYLIYTKTITIDNRQEQKEIVGYYNVLGQEITKETPGVQIILFSDGTTVKTFK